MQMPLLSLHVQLPQDPRSHYTNQRRVQNETFTLAFFCSLAERCAMVERVPLERVPTRRSNSTHPVTPLDPGESRGGAAASSDAALAHSFFEHLIHALVRPRCERGWPQDACDCILATSRVIQQAESFSLGRACSILLNRLNRPPRTMFLQ